MATHIPLSNFCDMIVYRRTDPEKTALFGQLFVDNVYPLNELTWKTLFLEHYILTVQSIPNETRNGRTYIDCSVSIVFRFHDGPWVPAGIPTGSVQAQNNVDAPETRN